MKTLRTPDHQFENLPDFSYAPHYLDYEGIRMHYVDEGTEEETILALHGEPTWSYLYRKFIPILSPKYRFIAPDMIGFGKSDKLTHPEDYSFHLHYDALKHLIRTLKLQNITLVVQDWGGLLGLSLLGEHPDWFKRVVIMNTFLPIGRPLPFTFKLWQTFAWYFPSLPIGMVIRMGCYQKHPRAVIQAYKAPFPSRKYKAGAKAFPQLVPAKPTDEGVEAIRRARAALQQWHKPALVMFSDKDPVMSGLEGFFCKLIPASQQRHKIIIQDAGHFLQEDKGEEIAQYIDRFIQGELKVERKIH